MMTRIIELSQHFATPIQSAHKLPSVPHSHSRLTMSINSSDSDINDTHSSDAQSPPFTEYKTLTGKLLKGSLDGLTHC